LDYAVVKFGFLALNYAAFGLKPLHSVGIPDNVTKGLDMMLTGKFYFPISIVNLLATAHVLDDVILIIATAGSSKQSVFIGRICY